MSSGRDGLASRACDGLLGGQNVVVVAASRGGVAACLDAMQADLYDLKVQVVPVVGSAADPLGVLQEIAHAVDPSSPQPLRFADAQPLLAEIDIVLLSSNDRRLRAAHLQLLADWSAEQRSASGSEARSLPRLGLVGWGDPHPAELPRTDVNLTHIWSFEFDDAVREAEAGATRATAHLADSLEREWTRRMLLSLAGDDVALVDVLMPSCGASWPEVEEVLRIDALARGWTPAAIEDVLKSLPGLRHTRTLFGPTEPPRQLRRHWAEGLLQWIPGVGLEMHAGALALAGRRRELEHRMWRTQTGWLLPLIDGLRRRICHFLTETRPGWHKRVECRQEDRSRLEASPLNAELPVLANVFYGSRHAGADANYHELVECLRDARNCLAHYQPVPLAVVRSIGTKALAVRDLQEVYL
jgi:hypothetical protein